VPPLALVGNLSLDRIDGGTPRAGGGPVHGGRGLRAVHARATTIARCAAADAPLFRRRFARLGLPVRLVHGRETTAFSFRYEGDLRVMHVDRIGGVWTEAELADLPRGAWVHLAALLRGDFPPETLAAIARGRRLSLDAQGLTRVREPGPLRLEADPDLAALLAHVTILKLAVEEAEALAGSLEPAALAALGPPEVVVTFGSRGSLVVADGRPTDVPARYVDADPTGSGDAFAAAYLVGRASGHPPAAAARRATAVVAALLSGSAQ
jgi:sugar/nucleoside kinase (ribokinase family)